MEEKEATTSVHVNNFQTSGAESPEGAMGREAPPAKGVWKLFAWTEVVGSFSFTERMSHMKAQNNIMI